MDKSRFFLPILSAVQCEYKKTVPGTLPYVQPYYHQHDGYELYLFLNGNVTYYIEHHCTRLEKGSLFFTRPGELHRVECDGEIPYERITINIRPSVLTALSTENSDLGRCFHTADGGLDNIILLNKQTIHELLFLTGQLQHYLCLESGTYGSDIMVNCYLSQILYRINQLYFARPSGEAKDIMPTFVKYTLEYIDQNLTQNITMADISDHVHHNADYISRSFKKITGISTQQYIIFKRIQLAKKYLAAGRTPNDTCCLSGFNDYSNFARTFKKQIGVSPRDYQRSNRFNL